MVEQPILLAAISSVGTFDGTKSKFDSCIVSMEDVAHISGQDILHIAFSKMTGSPLTSAHSLRDHLPCLMWNDVKTRLLRQLFTIPFNSYVTQALPIYSRDLMSYLRCTYIMPITCGQKYLTQLTWLKSLQKV